MEFKKLTRALGLKGPRTRRLPKGVSVGRHTYGVRSDNFHGSRFVCDVRIGAFCSVAEEVLFLQMADHDLEPVSSFPLGRRLFRSDKSNVTSKGPIIVGNDVWIGRRATVLSGVEIGDGAVIAACAVVVKDVPPFAIVAGNPGRVVKYRFDAADRDLLLRVRWWDWSDDELERHKTLLTGPSDAFLHHLRQNGV